MSIEASLGRALRDQTMSRRGRELAALADRQHGVVSSGQLAALGLSKHAVGRLSARGSLQRLHRGVYAVGHRPKTRQGWWLAAVLAAGPGAALGFRSAAALWCVRNTSRSRIEVITPRLCRRLTSPVSLDALLARYPRRRGTKAITRVLDNHRKNGETRTRSELERALLALLDAHDLPRPKINRESDHGELDARWPQQRLVVECDGFAAHGTREAFEDDRARDRALVVDGWRVVRVTWRQLEEDGAVIAAQLGALLAATVEVAGDGQAAARSPRAAAAAARPVRTAPSM